MDDEATVFEFERRGERRTVATFLRDLADGIERGRVELRHGDETLVVDVPDHLDLEVEVELEDEGEEGLESSIEVEITWRDGGHPAAEEEEDEGD